MRNTVNNSRRYYLHKQLKRFLKIDARKRTIFIKNVDLITRDKTKQYLNELISYGYACQAVIE